MERKVNKMIKEEIFEIDGYEYEQSVEIIGTQFFGEKIDITDPCYDRDTWCRMNDVRAIPGDYTCFVTRFVNGPSDGVITSINIVLEDKSSERYDISEMNDIGSIGVDAGLAGFFNNKPDFNDSEWDTFCDNIEKGDAWIYQNGFFSSSGYGDGGYEVYAHVAEGLDLDGKPVYDAFTIVFVEPDYEEYDDFDEYSEYEDDYDKEDEFERRNKKFNFLKDNGYI